MARALGGLESTPSTGQVDSKYPRNQLLCRGQCALRRATHSTTAGLVLAALLTGFSIVAPADETRGSMMTATAVAVASPVGGGWTRSQLNAATESFRHPKTPTSKSSIQLNKKPYKGSLWKVNARLLRDGAPMVNATLDLQVRLHGSWSSIKRKKTTNRKGWVSWHTTPDFPSAALKYPYRIHYAGNPSTKPSSSRTYRYGQGRAISRA